MTSTLNRKDSSFPYMENASQTTSTLKQMSTIVPEADLRAKNRERKKGVELS